MTIRSGRYGGEEVNGDGGLVRIMVVWTENRSELPAACGVHYNIAQA